MAALFGGAGLFLSLRAAGAIGPVVGARFQTLPDDPARLYTLAAVLVALALFAHPAIGAVGLVAPLLVWWKRRPIVVPLVSLCLGTVIAGVALLLAGASIERAATQAPPAAWNREATAAGDAAVRVQVAGRAAAFYVQKLLLPFPLASDYYRWQTPTDVALRSRFAATDDERERFATFAPDVSPRSVAAWAWPAAALVAIGGGIGFSIVRRNRGAAATIASFVLLLLPVLGFVSVGWMRNAFVADHLAYFASVPLLVGAVLLLAPLLAEPAQRVTALATVALVLAAYVGLGANVSRRYADSYTYWRMMVDGRRGNPRSPLGLLNLADATLRRTPPNPAEAAAALDQARNRRPSDPAVYVRIAGLFAAVGRPDEARQRLRFAMDKFPEDGRPFAAAADFFTAEATTRPTERAPRQYAFDYYKEAVGRDPENAEFQIRVGEAAYEIIARLQPSDPAIAELTDATAAAFDRAVQRSPYDVDRLVRMARVLVPLGKVADATGMLRTATAIDPKRADAFELVGDAHVLAKNGRDAEGAYRLALSIEPGRRTTLLRLGDLLATEARFDEAKTALAQAVEADPDDASAKRTLAAVTAMAATRPSATTTPVTP